MELYDFGAAISISVPKDTRPCPRIPPGLVKPGACMLGQTYDTLPKCSDEGSDKSGIKVP